MSDPTPIAQHGAEIGPQTSVYGGAVTTVLSTVWAFMGDNSTAIAALCSMIGVLMAVLGYRVMKDRAKADKSRSAAQQYLAELQAAQLERRRQTGENHED